MSAKATTTRQPTKAQLLGQIQALRSDLIRNQLQFSAGDARLIRSGIPERQNYRNSADLNDARYLFENYRIVSTANREIINGIIGTGITIRVNIDNPIVKKKYERVLATWQRCVDTRRRNLWTCQREIVGQAHIDGDIYALKLKNGLVQIQTADKLGGGSLSDKEKSWNWQVVNGVTIDELGVPQFYWFQSSKGGYKKFPADYVIPYIFSKRNVNDVRGFPRLSMLKGILEWSENYREAVLIAAKNAAHLSLAVEDENAATSFNTLPGTATEKQVRLENGTITWLRKGQKIVTVKAEQPNQGFESLNTEISRDIAATFGMPLEILCKRYESNFSASRLAILLWNKQVAVWQDDFVNNFLYPLLTWRIKGFVDSEELPFVSDDIDDFLVFHRPKIGYVDPQVDVQAALTRIDGGLSSVKKECEENGDDSVQILSDRAAEVKAAAAAGVTYARSSTTRDQNTTNAGNLPATLTIVANTIKDVQAGAMTRESALAFVTEITGWAADKVGAMLPAVKNQGVTNAAA